MALDFPSSPTDGQVFGQYTYRSSPGAWVKLKGGTALPGNRLVNPVFQINQENPASSGTGTYPADQWVYSFVGTAANRSFGRAASTSLPRGSPYYLYLQADNGP